MLDERNYPTMRFMRCKKCGAVFASSLAGSYDCPECSSSSIGVYRPGEEPGDAEHRKDDQPE